MKRLVIYCEGQTEETFVKRVLRHHLGLHGIDVKTELALTSLSPKGKRGGFSNWEAIDFDLREIFAGDRDPQLRFTTLLDVYAIPPATPGLPAIVGKLSNVADIESVEAAIEQSFGEPRFKAYLQRHEVEALLLADTVALANIFYRDAAGIKVLEQEIATVANMEDINHGPETHPAKRLENAIPGYHYLKADHFHWVLAEADFGAVRAKCPRFDAWLSHWESWGMEQG